MRFAIASALLLGLAGPALAHVGLAEREASIGSTYKATLVVGHGCSGAATTEIRVRIPEGFYNVRPMPKPGWKLETVAGPYQTPFDNHGTVVNEGVTEITWSGGELPDSQFDEFVFRGTFGSGLESGGQFHFPVLQKCGDKEDAWIDTSGDAAENPAPEVILKPPAGHQH